MTMTSSSLLDRAHDGAVIEPDQGELASERSDKSDLVVEQPGLGSVGRRQVRGAVGTSTRASGLEFTATYPSGTMSMPWHMAKVDIVRMVDS